MSEPLQTPTPGTQATHHVAGAPLSAQVAHYENFPVASVLCPKHLRPAIMAIYHFARTADDLADEGDATAEQRLTELAAYRDALNALYGFGGVYASGVLGWSITQIGVFGIAGDILYGVADFIDGGGHQLHLLGLLTTVLAGLAGNLPEGAGCLIQFAGGAQGFSDYLAQS